MRNVSPRECARFFRFILSGCINTGITYLVYLILLPTLNYQISYAIAYTSGIIISFFLNKHFVFKKNRGLRSILLFPIVYIAQYCFNYVIIFIWIEFLKLPEVIAPLAAVALAVPVTYLITRWVFHK